MSRYILWGFTDGAVVIVSFSLAWSARAVTDDLDIRHAPLFVLMAFLLCLGVNHLFHLYQRVWRYASAGEVVVVGGAAAMSSVLLTMVDLLWPGRRPVPLSVVWMMGLFAFVGFVSVRYRQRVWTGFRWRLRALQGGIPSTRTRVLIVGAGEAGQILAWRFQNEWEGGDYELVGFVDDDPNKRNMLIHGIRVLGDRDAIPTLVTQLRVALIVIAIYNIPGAEFRAILDACQQTSAIIKVLPDVFDFLRSTNGQALRHITAEDLLGRKSVEIDRGTCRELLTDRTALVSGAAGSIGSELCRTILSFGPRRLLALDTNETGLHDLTIELQALASGGTDSANGERREFARCVIPVVGDVTDEAKVAAVFEAYRPEIIFHAAAYKHVPLMEAHPDEAVRVNVFGTKVVATLAARYGAERFVLVSTDKAVNPRSVMGATKLICEMMITTMDSWSVCPEDSAASVRSPAILDRSERSTVNGPRTLFTAVRFGNVLGSRGSVVPTFERQIERGGPVTVTHPEMTRYFMSVSEAVSLVIQAATFTEGGDIFMLDMGQRMRIDDLARRLIRLRGLRPGVDIPIVYTGLRAGEKMHEELLGDGEELEPTSHPHIFRVHIRGGRSEIDAKLLDELFMLTEKHRNGEVAVRLRELVPPVPCAPEGIP